MPNSCVVLNSSFTKTWGEVKWEPHGGTFHSPSQIRRCVQNDILWENSQAVNINPRLKLKVIFWVSCIEQYRKAWSGASSQRPLSFSRLWERKGDSSKQAREMVNVFAATALTNSFVVVRWCDTDMEFGVSIITVLTRKHHTHVTWKLQLEESLYPRKKLEME